MALWYWHRTFIVEITHNIWTSFKTLDSKKATEWHLKRSQSNDKLLLKVIPPSCIIEQKTVIEASCTNNIQTGEKGFYCCHLKLCGSFLFRQSKNTNSILWSVWVFLAFLEVKRLNKYCLWEANLVFDIWVFGLMWQSVNLLWKTADLICVGCVFAYFCGGHKKNFRL